MKIAVDLRSLSSGSISGVENYVVNLLEHMLPLDRTNSYVLFSNAWSERQVGEFHFMNSQARQTSWPNRLLNLALKSGLVRLEQVAGDFDCLFMPNLNQFNLARDKKLVITVHDLSPVVTPEFYDVKRNLWHHFLNYRAAFNRADVLLAVSEYTKRDLVRIYGIPESKIRVVHPGVDRQIFRPDLPLAELRRVRNHYGLPGEFFLFLNTIEPRKNLTGLIRAFERLAQPIYLVIAGRPGWKYKQALRLIKNSRKSAKIIYAGYLQEKDKPAVIKLAKALVYPSFYEGFGFQPLEAMACGTPVIASQLTSLPEVVGDAGLLINPYSEDGLLEGMRRLLQEPALAAALLTKGLERVRNFSWQRTAELTLQGINSLREKQRL
ncbi:MAG TPA: glycosyltransferase family 1 protein [Patescibacteria group bacterium]|nr:glycosyltransferase family 1 protein [Patescibacteria group bacterium]